MHCVIKFQCAQTREQRIIRGRMRDMRALRCTKETRAHNLRFIRADAAESSVECIVSYASCLSAVQHALHNTTYHTDSSEMIDAEAINLAQSHSLSSAVILYTMHASSTSTKRYTHTRPFSVRAAYEFTRKADP